MHRRHFFWEKKEIVLGLQLSKLMSPVDRCTFIIYKSAAYLRLKGGFKLLITQQTIASGYEMQGFFSIISQSVSQTEPGALNFWGFTSKESIFRLCSAMISVRPFSGNLAVKRKTLLREKENSTKDILEVQDSFCDGILRKIK